MSRSSSRIRAEIERLQEQLKSAETREAERLGRIALRAGLGNLAIEDSELENAFAAILQRYGASMTAAHPDKRQRGRGRSSSLSPPTDEGSSPASNNLEA